MGERLTGMFAESRATGRAALLPYLTAGLPDPQSSTALFVAIAGWFMTARVWRSSSKRATQSKKVR